MPKADDVRRSRLPKEEKVMARALVKSSVLAEKNMKLDSR